MLKKKIRSRLKMRHVRRVQNAESDKRPTLASKK
jgi:hypothetical protein